jgi:hypothetical protein
MTPGCAALIRTLQVYSGVSFGASLIEVQKLMYFPQCAGEPPMAGPYLFWYGPAMGGDEGGTARRQLWDVALDHYGYVTTADAAALGIAPVELRKLAHRGRLEGISRGLYRFPDMPTSERDAFMEAVLWAGPDAALTQDAVLALHSLAFANPRTLRVATPHRVRKVRDREDITIVQVAIPADDLTEYFGIPSTTVVRALIDSRALFTHSRLLEAAAQARDQGLLLAAEYEQVINHLGRTYGPQASIESSLA